MMRYKKSNHRKIWSYPLELLGLVAFVIIFLQVGLSRGSKNQTLYSPLTELGNIPESEARLEVYPVILSGSRYGKTGEKSLIAYRMINLGNIEARGIALTAQSFQSGVIHFNGSDFPGDGGNCSDKLKPGYSCTFVLKYEPEFKGEVSDKIQFSYISGQSLLLTERMIFAKAY